MKKKYFIPFETKQERDRIRKWTGVTSGASLAVKTQLWEKDNSVVDDYQWAYGWTDGYVIDVTSKKAEMLIKLQFAQARRYFPQADAIAL